MFLPGCQERCIQNFDKILNSFSKQFLNLYPVAIQTDINSIDMDNGMIPAKDESSRMTAARHDTSGQRGSGKNGKPWKRARILAKAVLWIVGICIVLMATVQIVLSPSVLTGIVDRFAGQYVDGKLEFSKVSVSVIRSFPFLNVTLDSLSVTYPSGRFESLENGDSRAKLLRAGTSETADTLVSFSRFSASVDLAALVGGTIHIPNIELTRPRIFAKSYNDSTANWNIFKSTPGASAETGIPAADAEDIAAEADSASSGPGTLPRIVLERISLDGRPFIVFCSSEDTLFAALNLKEMKFRGRLSTHDPKRNRIGFMIDSLFVGGRMASDTLAFGLQELRMREQRGDFSLKAKAGAALATRSLGRIFLPVEIDSRVRFLRDTVPSVSISRFKANIAGLPVNARADLKFCSDSIWVQGNAAIEQCRVNDLLRFWGRNIFPAMAELRTDAVINLNAAFDGWYDPAGGRLPAFDISLNIPESPIRHSVIRMDSNIAADIWAKGGNGAPVNAGINDFHMRGKALDIFLKGSVSDLLGEDPLLDVNGGIGISLDTLGQFIRKNTGMDVSGRLEAEVKGAVRRSQMTPYTLASADLTAKARSDMLRIYSDKDSIDVHIDSLDILLATVGNRYDRAVEEGTRMIALSARLDSARVRYRDMFSASGSNLSLKAQNDAAILDDRDSSSYYPFGGRLEIGRLVLTDRDSNRVTLRNSDNTFRISPSRADKEIPVLSLKSDNGAIRLRSAFDRLSLRGLGINIIATKSDARRKRMAKAFIDSLSRKYPEIPRDSLFGHLRNLRGKAALPDWLTEEDFRKNDLDFRLDSSMAKYFREWDFYGDLKFRRASLMTPSFPLRTSLNGFDGYITNNKLTLKSFTLRSGKSDIRAKGELSGLRGALLANRPVSLNMDIRSDRLNINELLGAYTFGKKFRERADSLKAAADTLNDESYEDIIAIDTLATADIPEPALIVVPANITADISVEASDVSFAKMDMDTLSAKMMIRERCVQLTGIKATSNVGNLAFDGFYSTRTKEDITAGFSLNLNDITAEKIIEMIPAVDSLMPMLQSFYGKLDCELAATAQIDTSMNIIMPSLNGVLRIKGQDLALVESEDLFKIAKILKFKDIHNIHINDMSVEGLIGDNRVEIFPFVLAVDRYSLALSGIQGLDQSFKYHISILKSPLLIRFGVDLWGPDFDNMKFRIGRAKYKDANVPVFSAVIDETRLNLLQSIRNIFTKGVEAAVKENESSEAITEYKEKIDYRNAAETDMESLSAEESASLEAADDSGQSGTDNPDSHDGQVSEEKTTVGADMAQSATDTLTSSGKKDWNQQ